MPPERGWCLSTVGDQTHADLLPLLDGEETVRYHRFRHRGRAAEFLLGRILVRRLFGALCSCPPTALRFGTCGNDKPILLDEPDRHFNISHSAGRVLLCWDDQPVGCDLQVHDQRTAIPALAQRWFHADEYAQWRAAADPRRAFFDGWARKEAVLKAHGSGIAGGLQRFAIDLEIDRPQRPRWDTVDPLPDHRLTPLDAGSGFSAAVMHAGAEPLERLAAGSLLGPGDDGWL